MHSLFINIMLECGGISLLQARLLKFLTGVQKNLNQDALNFFALLLAKQNDGDTRIPVEEKALLAVLQNKMRNLGVEKIDAFSASVVNGARSIEQSEFENIVLKQMREFNNEKRSEK